MFLTYKYRVEGLDRRERLSHDLQDSKFSLRSDGVVD